MLKKQLSSILVILGLALCFASCEKEIIENEVSSCGENCQREPMPIWCGTGAVHKYYFNKNTRQCELYVYDGGDVIFETLEECQDCLCTRLVSNEED